MKTKVNIMRRINIQFPDHQTLCVFPDSREHLPQAISELNLGGGYPVIVLIGGFIQSKQAEATQQAIENIARFSEEGRVLIICGGSNLGVMASIGQTRAAHHYNFPLLGINLADLVTWPNGPRSNHWLWWGEKRGLLAPGYSHFILVPGNRYGEDSPWIADAATYLSKGSKSVTILANGGFVSRQDIALSLQIGRPVIALSGTGRLADEIANDPNKPALVMTVQAEDEQALREAIQKQFDIEGRQVCHDSCYS